MTNQEPVNLPTITSKMTSNEALLTIFKSVACFVSILFFVGLLAACQESMVFHKAVMRGQVVGVEESDVVLCIGSQDGAQAGQLLRVYRVTSKQSAGKGDVSYRKEYIGELIIDSIIDDHFARANTNSGDIMLHDVVELKQ